jgi:hypothetical protein
VQSWPRVVAECLNALERGEPPPTGAHDLERSITPVFEAYRMAGEI